MQKPRSRVRNVNVDRPFGGRMLEGRLEVCLGYSFEIIMRDIFWPLRSEIEIL